MSLACQKNSFELLSKDVLLSLTQWLGQTNTCNLAKSSPTVAYLLAECLCVLPYRVSFQLSFTVFLHAQHAIGPGVWECLNQFSFVSCLSRTCRSCGARTQRRVFGVILCEKCTRDAARRCWMVPVDSLVVPDHVRQHNGRRSALVLADELCACSKWTRASLRRHFCISRAYPSYSL